ncbi:hypothetical protein SAMN03159341_102527 [Paenibacillus sp. 1_12]|uniref:hypothetical protein n=1 Tax=Paenibacillus sp. 1_12 TaxID=1566278 RepID=UPI0008E29CE2|nr:hypothetical protein [Paenibacillus sp. 1_12]SFK98120.1 hypothetical protein SAMN03159341_102527 [Paenibacillus sp. 1_12]
MNHKLIVQKIALSTLLLSVAASPIYASAASESAATLSSSTISISQIKAIPAIASHKLVDPLDLAATYAPDTVSEWQTTLAQYEGALQKSGVFSTMATPVASVGTLSDDNTFQVTSASSTKLIPMSRLVEVMVQGDPAELPNPADIKFETITSVASIPAISYDLDQVEVGNATVSPSEEVGKVLNLATVTADNTLFKGRIDLEQAAQSKDAEAIRQSLSKLMKLYKEQIVKWETAK